MTPDTTPGDDAVRAAFDAWWNDDGDHKHGIAYAAMRAAFSAGFVAGRGTPPSLADALRDSLRGRRSTPDGDTQ